MDFCRAALAVGIMKQLASILFFHGILGRGDDWEEVASHLPEYHCFAIDLPGHGSTPFAENFLELVPNFKEPIHLVGYSMGGRLAMQYLDRFPERIATLTVVSAHFGFRDAKEKEARHAIDLSWAKQFIENPIDEVIDRWYDQPLFKSLIFNIEKRRQQNAIGIAKAFAHFSVARQPFLQPKDALYLVGEKDEKYRALYRNIPHEIIPNAGHAVHLENPKDLADAIRRKICSFGKLAAPTQTSNTKSSMESQKSPSIDPK